MMDLLQTSYQRNLGASYETVNRNLGASYETLGRAAIESDQHANKFSYYGTRGYGSQFDSNLYRPGYQNGLNSYREGLYLSLFYHVKDIMNFIKLKQTPCYHKSIIFCFKSLVSDCYHGYQISKFGKNVVH